MKIFAQQHNRIHRGFTLMEVMVSVSIFAIIMTVGIGALLTINSSYRQSQTQRQGIDSLTYSLETMSRRLRTARQWSSSNVYGGTGTSFTFLDQDNVTITYAWTGSGISMTVVNNPDSLQTLADGTYDLTPDNVTITDLSFTAFKSPGIQSYVQVNVRGTVTNGQSVSDFSFQTGISKRSADAP